MNFQIDGLLSADISEWVELNRSTHARWFSVIYAVNRLAQRRRLSLAVDGGDLQGIFAASLYGRGLTNFQGAMVLAERGITLGARTLLRNCFEDIFYLGAVQSTKEYYQKLVEADAIIRPRIARILLEKPFPLDAASRAKLQAFLATTPSDPKQKLTRFALVV